MMKLKIKIFSFMIVQVFMVIIPSQSELNAQLPYRLVWSDEFDYSGLPDADKWGYDIGGSGWGNGELQYYTNRAENATVENGNLVITAVLESYEGNEYTSARLVTRNKGDWTYGRIEVRAKLPEGTGTWPAIWMLPTDWAYGNWPNSGEIDIMEHVGYDMGRVHQTIHTQAYNHTLGTQQGNNIVLADVNTAFHIYAINWTTERINCYIDDQLVFAFANEHAGSATWPFDKRFHLLLNIAIGGSWGGTEGVDNEIFPQAMEIDYVRVYEIFNVKPVTGPVEVDPGQEGIEYSVEPFEDAAYTWTFPEDVEIVSGQGSAGATVNWGDTDGTVSVLQSYNGVEYTSTLDVIVNPEPGDGPLEIQSNESSIGSWHIQAGEGNKIETHYDE
jgi:beta-glucanase (GH16 family)